MPARAGLRPLKAWRYVGIFGPELMICVAAVRVGPVRQAFWAVWDRGAGRLHERTVVGRGGVELAARHLRVRDGGIQLAAELDEQAGLETVCPAGAAYVWTRKQAGIAARGRLMLDGHPRPFAARAVIDDTAGYHPRHTSWRWSAGVGTALDGRPVAWNLVDGINDPPHGSERTVWIAGEPTEAPPSRFAPDLGAVDGLRFTAEAVRARDEHRLLVRSAYRQPFGTFAGELPGGVALAEGYGVMESHEAYW